MILNFGWEREYVRRYKLEVIGKRKCATGSRMLDVGCWMLNFGFWIMN